MFRTSVVFRTTTARLRSAPVSPSPVPSQPGSTVLRGRCIFVRPVPLGRCAPCREGTIPAPSLDDPFPARPCDPDERLAITQNGGSRLSSQLQGARRPARDFSERRPRYLADLQPSLARDPRRSAPACPGRVCWCLSGRGARPYTASAPCAGSRGTPWRSSRGPR